MAAEAQLIRLLPLVVRLFPQLTKLSPLVGKIIPLQDIEPTAEEDLARELNPKYKTKQHEGFNDAAHVVKISDAIKCVEDSFNEKGIVWELVKAAVTSLAEGKTKTLPGENLMNAIVKCIREDALRQDTIRVKGRYRSPWARPAAGHGKGRGKF